ncbi:hypothetical protein [Coprococcus comes]|jgi:hypothetical protein|uniref:hypothetical protein n=1 Tax=Coprococcus comes TaxID=410072 RepID=UPI001896E063|nr:hypothetical protein [Coprococcus comes]
MDSTIIVAAISVIGSFTLVYLNSVKETSNKKYEIRREQLSKFYMPFYQKYCAGLFPQNRLSAMSFEARSIFFDLMTQNIYLMEPLSQAMYSDFYSAYLDLLEAENNNPEYLLEESSQKLDNIFSKLSRQILIEYKGILKKCHLPVPLI